jgi:hypothetical protein
VTIGVRSGWIKDCSGLFYHQPAKMEQMMECLVASIKNIYANIKEMKGGQEYLKEEMRAG